MEFEFVAGNLALDFANSVHDHGGRDPQDDLKEYADVIRWGRQAGLLSERQRRQLVRKNAARAKVDFERTLELRETVYAIFSRRAQGKMVNPGALRRLSWHLREVMSEVSLQSAGGGFDLTWNRENASLHRVWGEITRSAVSLLTSDKLPRVRQCAGENCSWLFLDTSRNGMRRWCDMQACGNRSKVQRFRKRKAGN